MLNKIHCEQFFESPIQFKNGLNIIQGDIHSTNSIGKSTLLMIVDFVFGGNSYIKNNSGAIKALGDHSFTFSFLFKKKEHKYIRDTSRDDIIIVLDKKSEPKEEISIVLFRKTLLNKYNLNKLDNSFRNIVSLYSRIWGKENDNVDKPLQSFSKEGDSISIQNLIKLYNQFNKIEEVLLKIKDKEETKKVINGIYRKNLVSKITKTQFNENIKRINDIEESVKNIQDNLLEYTLNIEELSSNEIIKLKTEKYQLLDNQALIKNKIKRLELNIDQQSNVKSKHLERLSEFFENPNKDKINEIESFHNKISKILKKQLESSLKVLNEENKILSSQINEIDSMISKLLQGVDSPKFIVEKVFDMTMDLNKLQEINRYYTEKNEITEELKDFNEALDEIINKILSSLQAKINNALKVYNSDIYKQNMKSPKILLGRKSYSYDHSDNTGTGKSYIDLINFDLTVLNQTNLPFLIHDSFMFKNIEDSAVDNILNTYSKSKKQIFISIDGTNKFKNQKILKDNNVLKLHDKKLLFKKDWRKNPATK